MKKMFVICYEAIDINYAFECVSEVFITDFDSILKTEKKYASFSTISSVIIYEAKINEENGQVIPGELVKKVK